MPMKGPHVFIAFACQSIPQDRKISIDNLLSKINVEGKEEVMPSFQLTFRLFLGFVAGEYNGRARIYIQAVSPSNKKLSQFPCDLEFKASLNHQVHINVLVKDFEVAEQGVYWFDVNLDQVLMTRIPIEVVYQQAKAVSAE